MRRTVVEREYMNDIIESFKKIVCYIIGAATVAIVAVALLNAVLKLV